MSGAPAAQPPDSGHRSRASRLLLGFDRVGTQGRDFGAWLARIRVPLGFVAAALFLLRARPSPLSLALGLPLAAAGLALRAAAAGHIRKNDALATTGPYRYCRNPLYLGSAILAAGFLLAAADPLMAALAAALFAAVYAPVIRREEAYLAQRFGPAFADYCRVAPRFLPRLWPARTGEGGAAASRFSLALYRRHREYNALLGYAAVAAILILKAGTLKPGPPWW